MKKIEVDFDREIGSIKPMNAVNNGPVPSVPRFVSNFEAYKRLRIPYARTHDASFCAAYGGEHTVDVNFIFPDFDADVNDPASYDFQLTDEYLKTMLDAGTEPFFRLGSKIEHWSKKYNTVPPKDFKKWAEICEHIIAHYTEGWANGHEWNIRYWEIWNEADGRPDDAPPEKKECWGGTKAQFYEFYKVVALHLKERFPHLKIGGPACTQVDAWIKGRYILMPWVDAFLETMRDNGVPLDFFSWHGYTNRTENFVRSANIVRKALDKYGYSQTESILNEWNYLDGWGDDEFTESIRGIVGCRGAAFAAAVTCACQNAPVDMLMYYDAQPGMFNGLFDYYSQSPLKAYYALYSFSELRSLGTQVSTLSSDKELYTVAAKGAKKGVLVAYYPSPRKKCVKRKKVFIRFQMRIKDVYLTDEAHDRVLCADYERAPGGIMLFMTPYSFVYIEGK